MLVAQAIAEDLRLVTGDPILAKYDADVLFGAVGTTLLRRALLACVA